MDTNLLDETYNDLGSVSGKFERLQEEADGSGDRDDQQNLHEKQGESIEIWFIDPPDPKKAWGGDHVRRVTSHWVILCAVHSWHNEGR